VIAAEGELTASFITFRWLRLRGDRRELPSGLANSKEESEKPKTQKAPEGPIEDEVTFFGLEGGVGLEGGACEACEGGTGRIVLFS